MNETCSERMIGAFAPDLAVLLTFAYGYSDHTVFIIKDNPIISECCPTCGLF